MRVAASAVRSQSYSCASSRRMLSACLAAPQKTGELQPSSFDGKRVWSLKSDGALESHSEVREHCRPPVVMKDFHRSFSIGPNVSRRLFPNTRDGILREEREYPPPLPSMGDDRGALRSTVKRDLAKFALRSQSSRFAVASRTAHERRTRNRACRPPTRSILPPGDRGSRAIGCPAARDRPTFVQGNGAAVGLKAAEQMALASARETRPFHGRISGCDHEVGIAAQFTADNWRAPTRLDLE